MVETALVVAAITGLVEALKMSLKLESGQAPIVSVVLGIGAGFLFGGFTSEAVFLGIVLGLMASGLYSAGGKVVLNKVVGLVK